MAAEGEWFFRVEPHSQQEVNGMFPPGCTSLESVTYG